MPTFQYSLKIEKALNKLIKVDDDWAELCDMTCDGSSIIDAFYTGFNLGLKSAQATTIYVIRFDEHSYYFIGSEDEIIAKINDKYKHIVGICKICNHIVHKCRKKKDE